MEKRIKKIYNCFIIFFNKVLLICFILLIILIYNIFNYKFLIDKRKFSNLSFSNFNILHYFEILLFAENLDTYNLISDIKIKDKNYFIGDIISLYVYSKKKPVKIYSEDKNIIVKKYSISKRKKGYQSIVEIQCFKLGTINLNPIKIEFGPVVVDLGNSNVKIISFMDKYNLNFSFPGKLKLKTITMINLFVIFAVLSIFVIIVSIIINHYGEILKLFRHRNKSIKKIIKSINKLKFSKNIGLKDKYYILSEIIKQFSIKLDYTSKILFKKVKYELSDIDIKSNYDFYNSKFNQIVDNIAKILIDKEKST